MDFAVWESAFASALKEFGERALAYLPNVAAAIGLLVFGWLIARLVRAIVTRSLTGGLSLLMRRGVSGRAVAQSQIGPGFIKALGTVLFWFVIALFTAAAVERLELTIAAALLTSFAAYMPSIVIALVIVFSAVVIGRLVYTTVERAAGAAGLPHAAILGRGLQVMLIFFGTVTAADQLGIQSTLLTVVVAVAVGSVLGGATLAFGLGSGGEVSNIVAIFYVLKNYRVGQVVRIAGIEGEIVKITQTGVHLASAEGQVLVPGRRFTEEASVLVTGGRS
jgi:small-conductance mechanosensitive channel